MELVEIDLYISSKKKRYIGLMLRMVGEKKSRRKRGRQAGPKYGAKVQKKKKKKSSTKTRPR